MRNYATGKLLRSMRREKRQGYAPGPNANGSVGSKMTWIQQYTAFLESKASGRMYGKTTSVDGDLGRGIAKTYNYGDASISRTWLGTRRATESRKSKR